MTSSERSRIEFLDFKRDSIEGWRDTLGHHHDWPVVYLLNNNQEVYVGETTRARVRLRQHLANLEKDSLRKVRVVINEEFNKSACLDLESRLIAWLHADTQFTPLNRNDGQQNSNYFERQTRYQPIFDEVFEQLRSLGLFSRTIPEIENLNLFKLSPFKALNDEQLVAVDQIVEGLFADLESKETSTSVVQGGPGTGKTIVAIYLIKLLRDIQTASGDPDPEEDGRFNDFFQSGYREALNGVSIGFVVPQQSLRHTIQKVFKRTPGLNGVKVISPYTVAGSDQHWDLLIVDEAHRLTHRGAGPTRGMFKARSQKLFGVQAESRTAIDWIIAKSNHQVFLLDGEQSVRPADVPTDVLKDLRRGAQESGHFYSLESQMRIAAGDEYLEFARRLLTEDPISANVPSSYELEFFDNFSAMRMALLQKESEVGLSRMAAGYAWRWESQDIKGNDAPFDIELDGEQLRWNRTATDWIASEGSKFEVGSVHTVQGYDLNYAGVIIGPDIVWDEETGRIRAIRENHFDREVRSTRNEEDLLEYIRNAYYVLLTRGMLGTYVYVCDPALRKRIRAAI